jgi:hypothetical protein
MASAMLIFSAKIADLHQIIPLVKAAAPEKMVCWFQSCVYCMFSNQQKGNKKHYLALVAL